MELVSFYVGLGLAESVLFSFVFFHDAFSSRFVVLEEMSSPKRRVLTWEGHN